MTSLTETDLVRYSRQMRLPEVGEAGQGRLKAGSVLLVGAGGLGSPAALYLAGAGVGRIGIIDGDTVDVSNLHRQVLHGTGSAGQPKTASAGERLRDLNPEIEVVLIEEALTSSNGLRVIADFDLVLDGSDNFPTRYLTNDACVLLGKPNVYGSVFRFEGQASFFHASAGPCYRCIYSDPPPPALVPSCEEGGVLGTVPGIIGLIQATEAIKWLAGLGSSLLGRLLLFDGRSMQFRELKIPKNPRCKVCGENPEIKALIDYDAYCGTPKSTANPGEITAGELRAARAAGRPVRLIDVRETHEWAAARIDGAQHIPLRELPMRLSALSPDEEIVLYCQMGGRSARGRDVLREAGFRHVKSLAGGIQQWLRELSDSTPRAE
ncbi:MAG TPA: molybdopterin-synthase adenylyltransferase MoeB [Thermoanaerobaculia bacterium]|nr:molybdopterin-synthase adenylyltransferase MoeB [Thermoanaerobaculia bacterium]